MRTVPFLLSALFVLPIATSKGPPDGVNTNHCYPPDLVLWNKFDDANLLSEIGPNFYQVSFKKDDWGEAQILDAKFGNGLRPNQVGATSTDGANFFITDLWEAGLTAAHGTIEFWSKFQYSAGNSAYGYFFNLRDEITGHYRSVTGTYDDIPRDRSTCSMAALYNAYGPKRYQMALGTGGDAGGSWFETPSGTASFGPNDMQHFAFVWDVNGIEGSTNTVRIYVDGEQKGQADFTWDPSYPLKRFLYLGTAPNSGYYDHYYESFPATTDNVKIWSSAKTDFSDRSVEEPAKTYPCNKQGRFLRQRAGK